MHQFLRALLIYCYPTLFFPKSSFTNDAKIVHFLQMFCILCAPQFESFMAKECIHSFILHTFIRSLFIHSFTHPFNKTAKNREIIRVNSWLPRSHCPVREGDKVNRQLQHIVMLLSSLGCLSVSPQLDVYGWTDKRVFQSHILANEEGWGSNDQAQQSHQSVKCY